MLRQKIGRVAWGKDTEQNVTPRVRTFRCEWPCWIDRKIALIQHNCSVYFCKGLSFYMPCHRIINKQTNKNHLEHRALKDLPRFPEKEAHREAKTPRSMEMGKHRLVSLSNSPYPLISGFREYYWIKDTYSKHIILALCLHEQGAEQENI